MIDSSEVYDKDYLGWVSPAPEQLPKYLSLINPLQPLVWLLVTLSLLMVGVIVYGIARLEGRAVGRKGAGEMMGVGVGVNGT